MRLKLVALLGAPCVGGLALAALLGVWNALAVICGGLFLVASALRATRSRSTSGSGGPVVGFFHPYCNDGGGGERVLWCAIAALEERFPGAELVVYTGVESVAAELAQPSATEETVSRLVIKKVAEHFNVTIRGRVRLIMLKNRSWVDAAEYPHLTLLGQSVGSLVLAWEALRACNPTVFVDTMGYAFSYPLASVLFGCRVACYTHYPTISTDMLLTVKEGRASFNNSAHISNSSVATAVKYAYYLGFALLYGLSGRFAQVVMVNSSWTKGHIDYLWFPFLSKSTSGGRKSLDPALKYTNAAGAVRLFPPCDNRDKLSLAISKPREKVFLSIAQYRPEKNHMLQVDAFADLLAQHPGDHTKDARLVMLGSSRNADDEARVDALRARAKELKIDKQVDVITNVKYADLLGWLGRSLGGLHTMTNEHFGISIVEFMAAGVVPIANHSGGPKADIVSCNGSDIAHSPGFLATTKEEYSAFMWELILLHTAPVSKVIRSFTPESADPVYNVSLKSLQFASREASKRFNQESFMEGFNNCMAPLML